MKILLINNNTVHLKNINQALAGHDVETQVYKPGLKFNDAGKDLVILSGGGGEGLEIYDQHAPGRLWYEDQMKFILSNDKPLIGICMGFEVIASAYDAKIHQSTILTKGFKPVTVTDKGKKLLEKTSLNQFESHYWQLRDAPRGFDVMAESDTGVEIIKHKTKPIFATQFHPEKGGTLRLDQLVVSSLS